MLNSWKPRARKPPYFWFTTSRQSQSLAVFLVGRVDHSSSSHLRIYCRRGAAAGSSSYQKSRKTLGSDSGWGTCNTRLAGFLWGVWQPRWVCHRGEDPTGAPGRAYVEQAWMLVLWRAGAVPWSWSLCQYEEKLWTRFLRFSSTAFCPEQEWISFPYCSLWCLYDSRGIYQNCDYSNFNMKCVRGKFRLKLNRIVSSE